MSKLDESITSSAKLDVSNRNQNALPIRRELSKFFSQSQPRNHLDGVHFLTEHMEVWCICSCVDI